MDLLIPFLIMIFFLCLKAFFSGSEIAIVNSDKFKMRHLAKTGDRKAALLLKMFRTPDVILGTTLVGTNVATVTISTMGAIIAIEAFGEIGDIISVLIMTPFLLIFGEIVPKSIFQQKADSVAQGHHPLPALLLPGLLSGDLRLQPHRPLRHPPGGRQHRRPHPLHHPGGVERPAGHQ
jgi:Mg2+/Co2+ transporter CorB